MLRIRIANPPRPLLEQFSEHEKAFYFQYAKIIHGILNGHDVQNFLDFLIKEEELDKKRITDIRIMVFPFGSTEGGRNYAEYSGINLERMGSIGLYNAKRGIISIYPILTDPTPESLIKLEDEAVVLLIGNKAIVALLEEILHTKYNRNYMDKKNITKEELENEVRLLVDKYFEDFLRARINAKHHD